MKNLFTKKVGFLNKINKALIKLWIFCSLQLTAFAINIDGTPHTNHLAQSKFITGLINLMNDAIKIIAPIAVLSCGGLAMYFFMRQNAASEEQERSRWHKRIVISIYSAIGITIIVGFIYVITAYFK